DVPLHRRKHLGATGQPQAQAALAIVPGDIYAHELAFAKIEALAVVFIKRKGSIRAGVNPECKGAVDRLLRILLHRAHGNYRAGADVEWRGFEIHVSRNLAPAFHLLFRPEIVPEATRKIEGTGGGPLLDHRSDKNVPAI